ncbi:M1 family metallopeptidase [Nocardioides sp.]|uniref:M1 family metallopeptidase n=1 Tax=Nocardioides sp. TaxID=35761 RepID=UPI003563413F
MALLTAALLAGCTGTSPDPGAGAGSPGSPGGDNPVPDVDDPALKVAESEPVEDSVYPEVGDPGVDALAYDLDLAWEPDTETLTGVETLVFRSTEDDDDVQLDLSAALTVSSVQLDGQEVEHERMGKDLVVRAAVEQDRRYTLRIAYSGTPTPVTAPTTRSDFSDLGWRITDSGETWTMQEPYGAYSWYAVNDHPSDKALYSFTISAPSPFVGVANGELVERTDEDGTTTTRWELDAPAASYLVTAAIGEFRMTTDSSPSGVPISYWTAPGDRSGLRSLRVTPEALDWLEARLGPYPFETLGIVLVDSQSGMETQTMITLGRTEYTTSARVIVHELVHQWYGDLVTPTDWTALWMNEGMAMYLQGVWMVEFTPAFRGQTIDDLMDEWANFEPILRRESGPPAAFDPAAFGEGNVYYGPALMWHELRRQVGDDTFWTLVRDWPQVNANGNATAEEYLAWLDERTDRDLTSFFRAWLYGKQSPKRR